MRNYEPFMEVLSYLIPVVFLIAGVAFLIKVDITRKKDRELLRRWTPVTGTVLRADLTGKRDEEGCTIYTFDVEYEYATGDQRFRATRLRWFDQNYGSSSEKEMRKALSALVPGGPLELVYDPARPHDAMAARQILPAHAVVVAVALGVMFVGIGVIGILILAFAAKP